jgi:hypothetical protein
MNPGDNTDTQFLLAPDNYTAAGSTPAVDTQGLEFVKFVMCIGATTAAGNFNIQDSADGSTDWATITQVGYLATDDNTVKSHGVRASALRRYLRINYTVPSGAIDLAITAEKSGFDRSADLKPATSKHSGV